MYVEHLDVRSILRAKGNPFKRITETVNGLSEGGVFELRTTFRPTPLYRVLKKKGFSHNTVCLEKGDFLTQFYHYDEVVQSLAEVTSGDEGATIQNADMAADGETPIFVVDVADKQTTEIQHLMQAVAGTDVQPLVVLVGEPKDDSVIAQLQSLDFAHALRLVVLRSPTSA